MKLSKLFAGEYELNTTVDGYQVRVEASYGEMMRGFNVAYFVNDELIFGDGFTGMTLYSIKQGLESNVEDAIKEYRK
jgi:hypothetical protein